MNYHNRHRLVTEADKESWWYLVTRGGVGFILLALWAVTLQEIFILMLPIVGLGWAVVIGLAAVAIDANWLLSWFPVYDDNYTSYRYFLWLAGLAVIWLYLLALGGPGWMGLVLVGRIAVAVVAMNFLPIRRR